MQKATGASVKKSQRPRRAEGGPKPPNQHHALLGFAKRPANEPLPLTPPRARLRLKPPGVELARLSRSEESPSRPRPALPAPLRKPRRKQQAPAPPQRQPPPGRHSQGPPSSTPRQPPAPLWKPRLQQQAPAPP